MIAIIHQNTLAALGLASIIEKMMPMAEVTCFSGYAELEEHGGRFFHYFIINLHQESLICSSHLDLLLNPWAS